VRIVVYGPGKRIGSWEGDEVVDLNWACAKYLRERDGERRPHDLANALVPADLLGFIEGDERSLDYARKALDHLQAAGDRQGPDGEQLIYAPANVKLHAPLPMPGAPIACMGANYIGHSQRMLAQRGIIKTEEEVRAESRAGGLGQGGRVGGFWKLTFTIAGHEDPVIAPSRTEKYDYEGEVAIVIGKKARKVSQGKVGDHIWGVTTCVDWSIRDGDDNGNRTFRHAKNFDTSVSMGPSIVVGERDAQNQDMETRLNGELRQQYNSKGMTYSFAEIVEFLSGNFTLFPGFVLSGGCGPGTAMETGDPTKFLKPGDVVEYTSPRIGTLRNRIVAEED
jgi:2-keto-4-pentenoate hydratase/2-oxohepta-3-ene-1,7-dioic acid hydratase in catechol pathway